LADSNQNKDKKIECDNNTMHYILKYALKLIKAVDVFVQHFNNKAANCGCGGF